MTIRPLWVQAPILSAAVFGVFMLTGASAPTLDHPAPPAQDTVQLATQPDLYVLAIGTKNGDLKYPEQDARAIARLFAGQAGRHRLFGHVRINTLLGSEATGAQIKQQLSRCMTTIRRNTDILLIYISCHGEAASQGLQLIGSFPTDDSTAAVDFDRNIMTPLKALPGKKVIFLDACYSGPKGIKSRCHPKVSEAIIRLNSLPGGVAILSSSNNQEESYEDRRWRHGVFTQALLDGLRQGQADKNKDHIICLNELADYVNIRVPELLKKAALRDREGNPAQQHPTRNNQIGDMPLFLY